MPPETQPAAPCAVCRQLAPPAAMAQFGAHWVCASCKAVAVQRLREGVPLTGDPADAGQEPGGVLASLSDPELGVVAFRLGQPSVFPDYCPVTRQPTTTTKVIGIPRRGKLRLPTSRRGWWLLTLTDHRYDWVTQSVQLVFLLPAMALAMSPVVLCRALGLTPPVAITLAVLLALGVFLVGDLLALAWQHALAKRPLRWAPLSLLHPSCSFAWLPLRRPRYRGARLPTDIVVIKFRDLAYVRDLLRLNAPGAEPRPAPAAPADR